MQPQNTPATAVQGTGRVDLAVVQFAPSTEPSENLAMVREHVRAAADAGASVVVAPEYSMFAISRLDHRVVAVAEALTGPFVTGLAAMAADYGVHLVAGVVEATAPGEDRIHNTLVALGPDGALLTRYRKVHLYDAFGHRESEVVRAGEVAEPAVFTVGEVTFGMQTCFDLRFPEGCRRVAAAGAQVLLLPAQWIPGPGKVEQWTTLLRARAIENTVYVAAADQAARRGAGASMIIDPAGVVLAELGDEPGMRVATVDLARVTEVRLANPSLDLRRFEVVERAAE
ncbi:carbon-nitrogen hydrolase family protein [Nocardia cyriacigeorgica]|uniref:Carbon-nitrogen hydrolase family protein n=2 Tax=Nocardia cyriacigeorgica TaxID=135487 RepID=A0A6P1D5M1_9NOCA|nr:carbon-nitrogen hydrolase family protein [Nocardia cyriacigeorgica]NEW40319.1 carbon-nitrogen hydrolase family protein [Nocardia cyriacigeorgica]NEW43482.1 carbon-nitrogen hydrolase family protein [Nocardia cyriacigeorgica]NEW50733.1 carbon-nitrogen hydrolase family protein [Nocardia cyriacigeorgica]NEW54779.1 carbon-nitrogen hydrolase family protein [Nocardia cyriacigeorgica]